MESPHILCILLASQCIDSTPKLHIYIWRINNSIMNLLILTLISPRNRIETNYLFHIYRFAGSHFHKWPTKRGKKSFGINNKRSVPAKTSPLIYNCGWKSGKKWKRTIQNRKKKCICGESYVYTKRDPHGERDREKKDNQRKRERG